MASAALGFIKNDDRLAFDDATHSYRLGDLRLTSVTKALALCGLADFNAPWFSDAVKARGTFLHEAIALDVSGELDEASLDPELEGGLAGWRAFMEETGAEIEHGERMLCDPDLQIAGRLDYIVRVMDRGRPARWLIDVKRGLYPCAAIQLAAYVDMAVALYQAPVLFQRKALVLPGDGTYKLVPFTDSLDRVRWQSCVTLVNWRRQYGDLKEAA